MYFQARPLTKSPSPGAMNWTHRNLLAWSFHTKSDLSSSGQRKNSHFDQVPDRCKMKRKYEAVLHNSSLVSLVACRLREGFTISEVATQKDHIEIKASIPWKPGSMLHYVVQSAWPAFPPGV